jgi:CheY-like chemotaxis protein/HPt (histidine-containing phosphotransfer) domain-containing protein
VDPIEQAIKTDFLQEARELLEELERGLVALGSSGGASPRASELDAIFRVMHTIKGSAMVAGFDGLGAFAHAVETLLAQLRSRQLAWSETIGDLLLRANDRSVEIVSALTQNFAAVVATDDIVTELKACLASTPQAGSPEIARGVADPQGGAAAFGFFDAPPAAPAATPKADARPPAVAPAGEPATVLLCDDDSDLRELMHMYIEQIGYRCIVAGSGREGLAVAAKQAIDVVLTDLRMPDMDGASMAEELRARRYTAPIIFCSGQADRSDMVRFLNLGAFDFLEKPIEPARLEAVLLNAVHAKRVRDASVRLSALTFKTYLSLSMALDKASCVDPSAAQAKLDQIGGMLDEIAALTHYIVSPRIATPRAKDGI